jgi:lipoyl(octanoyl) transferase
MATSDHAAPRRSAALMCHLLGTLDFASSLALQQRLVYETAGRNDGAITLLVCEHPRGISVGRQGSRSDIHFDTDELRSLQLDVQWVNRGGGTLLHAPGQLAIYPIVPLAWHGWTVGEYLNRLETGLQSALAAAGFATQQHAGQRGLWGRSGQLATIGAAVRSGVTYHGAFVNVDPNMQIVRRVCTDREANQALSSLVAERPRGVRMASVRQHIVSALAEAFETPRHHLLTGHPLLVRTKVPAPGVTARAG